MRRTTEYKFNPVAVVIWAFVGMVAYLISGDIKTAMVAVCVVMGVGIALALVT